MWQKINKKCSTRVEEERHHHFPSNEQRFWFFWFVLYVRSPWSKCTVLRTKLSPAKVNFKSWNICYSVSNAVRQRPILCFLWSSIRCFETHCALYSEWVLIRCYEWLLFTTSAHFIFNSNKLIGDYVVSMIWSFQIR